MGIIPQLQCKKCQLMYHHECVGRDGSRSFGSFICEVYQQNIYFILFHLIKRTHLTQFSSIITKLRPSIHRFIFVVNNYKQHCIREKAEKAEIAQNAQLAAAATQELLQNSTISNELNGSSIGTEQIARQKDRSSRKSILTTTTAAVKSNPSVATNKRTRDEASVAASTTLNISNNSSIGENNIGSTPQSVAVVAGRKYIMVPKTNKPNISPSTGVDNINGVVAVKSS